MAWFEPPDRDAPPFKSKFTIAPAIALTPATLPPRIAGMAWFRQPEAFFRDRRPQPDMTSSFTFSQSLPIAWPVTITITCTTSLRGTATSVLGSIGRWVNVTRQDETWTDLDD